MFFLTELRQTSAQVKLRGTNGKLTTTLSPEKGDDHVVAPRVFAAALRSPTAPCAPQLDELAKAKVMSSGDLGVV